MTSTGLELTRERHALRAASFTRGPGDLLDFLIPLWAGAALGLAATDVGLLVALELVVSIVVRPVAGRLCDRVERRTVAALGAIGYGVSCVGYAAAGLTGDTWVAFAAAAVGGVGGSLLWVALRSIVSERLEADSGVFPRLLAAEETGAWIAFVAGLSLLGSIDFEGVFALCAASCLVGAVVLWSGPRGPSAVAAGTTGAPGREVAAPDVPSARRLSPILLTVVVTAMAETAVGILLLLHLQRHFELGVLSTAYVFLPGAIAMAVLPEPMHRVVLAIGRRRAMVLASVFSATFAVGLALAGGPWVIAALWLLTGVAWAVIVPVEQAVITELSPGHAGRALGIYESAGLTGAAVGAAAAGLLYDVGSWQVACLASAGVILLGGGLAPWALGRLSVEDRPREGAPPGAAPQDVDSERATS